MAVSAGMTVIEGWHPADPSRPVAAWGTRLVGRHRVATPELLLRMPDGGYVPVLVRGHRTTDPGQGALLTPIAKLADWPAPADGPASRSPTSVTPSRPAEHWVPIRRCGDRKLRSHHADVLALAHVYRLLQELGLASAAMLGGIIGFGGSSTDPAWDDGALIAWHRLDAPSNGPGAAGGGANASNRGASNADSADSVRVTALEDYDARFADRLAVAVAAATREPALAQPSRIAECRRCPWWPVCEPELAAAHDVSLLVAGGDVEILRAAGARTFDDVAAMDPAQLAELPLTGIPATEARIRARALISGAPMIRRTERVDVVRADVELDVDMESYLDDGAYLWGTFLTGIELAGFPQGYRPFVTWHPLESAATATNFVAFWQYLTRLRAACSDAGLSFAAYCYSHKAEERWLYGTPARFPGEPGMPARSEIAEFCSSPQWVDLYQEIKRLFVVPGSLRLKAVAPVAGFAWRDPEPGGENSMAWYLAALEPADGSAAESIPADVTANRRRILQYNEDDVLATLRLREWMSEESHTMPTVAALDSLALPLPSGTRTD